MSRIGSPILSRLSFFLQIFRGYYARVQKRTALEDFYRIFVQFKVQGEVLTVEFDFQP